MPNIELAHNLPFLEATIFECLRLYPPVPREMLQSTSREDLALPDGTIVRDGYVILWSPWVSARLPTILGDDVESFRPERWMERCFIKPNALRVPYIP